MPTVPPIPPLIRGNTHRFQPVYGANKGALYKNGVVWNVTGFVVNLLVKDVLAGTTTTVPATVTDATNGVCYADLVIGNADQYSVCWQVMDGTVNGDKTIAVVYQTEPAP